ncbi:hypothetical protein WUBG_13236, partial [Wuchereria bancrofti]
ALKDNPNLVYHPQRKKLSKILMKTDPPNMTIDTAPSTPLSNESAAPVAFAAPSTPKISKFLFNHLCMAIYTILQLI